MLAESKHVVTCRDLLLMRYFITLILTSICVLACSHVNAGNSDEIDEALSKLDNVIEDRQYHRNMRKHAVDSLCRIFDSETDTMSRILLAEKIGYKLSQTNIDSARNYFETGRNLAEEIGDNSLRLRLEAHRISMIALGKDLFLGAQMFSDIDTTQIIDRDKQEFYSAGSRLYLSFASFVSPEEAIQFRESGRLCAIRYLEHTPRDTPPYNYVDGLVAFLDNRKAKAKALLSDVIENTKENDMYRSFAEEALGAIALNENDYEEATLHLTNAVTLDIQNGVTIDNAARLLAITLMRDGDFKRADVMLELALDNAIAAGDRMRFTQAARIAPTVTDSYRRTEARFRTLLILFMALYIISLIAIAYLWHTLHKNRRKSAEVQQKIKDADLLRMNYFHKFLTMCAVYIEKLEDYKKLTHRKIKAGQTEELLRMVKSGDMVQQQTETFYSLFDSAFIQAYPTFVKDVNRLMQPDKMLDIPPVDCLSTDFRILAFMRIGFDDSSQIARFMGLSVNTIYTYRNRLRSRALDRDSFESNVMNIGD